jgi:predicted DNA-binding transcriptional regulator AlpA
MSGSGSRGVAAILPRLIRFRDAPRYLGMDRNRFNSEVRPYLTEVPIGRQGVGFDRLEIDAWVDQYISRNGRPPRKRLITWDVNECLASSSEPGSGTSTNVSEGGEFAKALGQLNLTKRKPSSRD